MLCYRLPVRQLSSTIGKGARLIKGFSSLVRGFLTKKESISQEGRTKEGSIDQSTTARPTLVDPNLRAITALVVILGTLIGTAADGLLVATPVALYGSFIPVFIVAAVVVPPHAEAWSSRSHSFGARMSGDVSREEEDP